MARCFTVTRAFLPNERAWLFCYLFQTEMPALLGRDFVGRVKVIVTDGDSQETSQLDIAIALHLSMFVVCNVAGMLWTVVGFAVVMASDAFQG